MDQPVPMLLSCALLEYEPYTTVPTNPSVAGCQVLPAGTRRTSVQLLSYVPAAQLTIHAETAELPPGEVVPAGHATHALELLAPVTFEYVPATQLAHTVVPNWPGGHDAVCSRSRPDKFCEQFSAETDPACEDDPGGHSAHAPPFGP